MNKISLLFFLCFFIGTFSISQQELPNNMTPQEAELMPAYLSSFENTEALGFTTPPSSSVRTMAEWEELQGLIIGWVSFPSMLKEIVRAAKEECRVYIITNNPNSVRNALNNDGIDTVNVTFVNEPFNSVWSRDYGPWSVYTDDVDTLLTIDWIYNRPRPKDDLIPIAMADLLNTPLYQTTQAPYDLVHCGGNFMVDGFGTAFSSNLVLDENPSHTEAEIDLIMKKFMGIDRYIKMPNLPYDGIHHIDMHMKLLDEETILVGQYPDGVADGPQIEANLLYVLSNFNSVFGTPYKIVRIPMPADAYHGGVYPDSYNGEYWTYTNSTIINKTVIVPTYDIPDDEVALQIYRDAMPGYKIVGINSFPSIASLGALHCITKEIGTDDPLLISHQSLEDTEENVIPYSVKALIKHRSGIQNATLYYTTDTLQPYLEVAMTSIPGQEDYFEGLIPAQYNGTTVYYYIHAEAVSGKEQVRPMPAPKGYFYFNVYGDDEDDPIDEEEEEEDDDTSNLESFDMGMTVDRVFPNPASAITCIPLNLTKSQNVSIKLYDVTGKLVQFIFEGVVDKGQQFKFFDASTLAKGAYMIAVQSDFGVSSQKVIVK